MSEFDKWFEAQHGPRCVFALADLNDHDLHDKIQSGRLAEQVLRLRELWDAKRTSALYAWNAAKEKA